ncbi:very short patch repair endonuclease [Mesobacillus subterraneus]|uniref:Very short patch repair endonuclease n=1 Tax=Mesobacillus subterraneus TaxID=285983 RepID=A0A427TTL2_9BACI|nr:very short patch repair endonuclease [Mesobacillus subterraneus]RSD27618.1 very short patch repair endonuclease [Mesobacillus subterraneus]
MADRISKETRSKNMKAIRSVSKLEYEIAKELWRRGVRFRRNVKNLKGKPDIAIKKYKIAIFIDSCFWHACPKHGNMPKSNLDYWEKKLERNVNRDREITDFYLENGWNVKRVWEHEVKENFDKVIEDIISFIQEKKIAH